VFTRISGVGPRDYFTGGRHRLQLFVASDRHRPDGAHLRTLPDGQRHRPRLDQHPSAPQPAAR
jgi:hypothetical protein